MCDNSSPFVVLKQDTDGPDQYVIKNLDLDTDENTLIFVSETCESECNVESCCKEKTCKTTTKFEKYKSSDICIKTFDYSCYIDSKCKDKMNTAKCLLSCLKNVLQELVDEIVLLKSNISSYDSKSMKCYLATYKKACHKFIKNFQLTLNKKYDCCGLVKHSLNIYKCECNKCLKCTKIASFNNVNCLNSDKEINLIYSIPGFTINLNTNYSHLVVKAKKCKYDTNKDDHNIYTFTILPKLKVKKGKLSKSCFLSAVNAVYDYCDSTKVSINEFFDFLDSNITEINEILD